jgi:hypothetical protein
MPITRPEDDRDDARLAGGVALERTGYLDTVTILRRKEVRADKKQDDVRTF